MVFINKQEECIIDITSIEIDIQKDKNDRIKDLLEKANFKSYNRKVRVGSTIIEFNFPSKERITNRTIMKALDY